MKDMDLETQLRSVAAGLEYPPTPDIAGLVAARLQTPARSRLRPRTFARSLAFVLVLLSSLLLIPPVRAAVVEFIEVGIVRIFRSDPAPAPLTTTPAPTPPALIPLLEQLAGETTLAEAEKMTGYVIPLPSYPPDLGTPDRVFVQDADGPMAILVWVDRDKPGTVRMSLHLIPEGSWAVTKMSPSVVRETRVDGQYAVWAEGPYPIRLESGDMQLRRMIAGHVLIWERDGVTYRLETDLSLEEAIRIAESLEPVP